MTAAKASFPRSRGFLVLFTILLSLSGNLCASEEDELLQALDAEAGKIGSTGQQEAPTGVASAAEDPESRAQFEELLRERYHGSYVFYQKLPSRMQQEIYDDYASGEDFAQLRKKIINRYLQQ